MVARIELHTQNTNESGEQVKVTNVLAEIDRNKGGNYETPLGVVGIRYEAKIPELGVILDCSRAPKLQGSREITRRKIGIGKKGVGAQQISPSESVVVDLDGLVVVREELIEVSREGRSLADVGSMRTKIKAVERW